MITFIEDTHLYLNEKQEKYKSVTSVLKEFEPKKDWEKIKKNYAKKHKLSVEEVTQMWDKAKNDACAKGTAYHKFRELELVANQKDKAFGKELEVRPSYCIGGVKKSTPSLILEEGIYPELIIWLDSAKIAGQADIVVIADGKIHIQDYKTNKKIDKQGYVNWEKKEEKLVYPLDHLGCCNYNTYSLQLSMYMYMLQRHNPKLGAGKLELLHVTFEPSEEGELVKEVSKIPVPYLKTEVNNILKHKK